MLQIKNTLGGGKPEGLYAWKKNSIGSELKVLNKSVSTLPYSFYNGCAVVLNGEIHILGTNDSSNYTKHYKWNGSSWTFVSTLPYDFYYGSAVVLNGEIHILGGNTYPYTQHYKWNGSSWISVSTLPYNFYNGAAVVLNGEIHILGSGSNNNLTRHYKWNGSRWTSVSTLPYNFYQGSAVVLNNEIHILGGVGGYTSHYKWDGSSWTSVNTLPYNFHYGAAVIFEDEIHILGGVDNVNKHYKWDGSSWTSVNTLPYNFYSGSAVIFNNQIHILGSINESYTKKHYLVYGYAPVYTFLDYIVSDKETAYPDGGEKGGYYYEKVSEGAKVASGSLTWKSGKQSISIEHGLNKAPNKVLIASNYCRISVSYIDGTATGYYLSGSYNSNVTITVDDININIMIDSYTAQTSIAVTWIAVAE